MSTKTSAWISNGINHYAHRTTADRIRSRTRSVSFVIAVIQMIGSPIGYETLYDARYLWISVASIILRLSPVTLAFSG